MTSKNIERYRRVASAFRADVNTAVQVSDTSNEDTPALYLCWRKLLENREQALFIAHSEGVKGVFKE
jgi:hypothetical protein